VSTMPKIFTKKLRVTAQQFTAHNPQPKGGKGFVNFNFEDNRKECLCDLGESVCWKASLTMKAFSSTNGKPDPEKDLLLMEATASVEGTFAFKDSVDVENLKSFVWHFDEVCKQKLLSKMRLLLLDTEFAHLPLPGNS